VQETPEAALVAVQVYLLTTQPEPGDPREHMHQAAIKILGLVEGKLKPKFAEDKSIYHEHKEGIRRRYQSPHSQRTSSLDETNHKARREDARTIIAQARVNKARYAWDEENNENEEK
jgi:hypothetical protein